MDLPLHPLIIHLTVIVVPVAALVALLFALVPRWRWLLRWPTALLAVLAAAIVQVSLLTGEALAATFPQLSPVLQRHEQWGERLCYLTYGFAVIALLAAWVLPSVSPLVSGRGARDARGGAAPGLVLRVLLPLVSAVVIVVVFITGHAGATAVWG